MDKRRMDILGIPVDMVDMDRALNVLDKLMAEDGCSMVVTPNSEIIIMAGKNRKLWEAIQSADLVIPDGIGLVYASRLMGTPLRERVTGFDFLARALERLEEREESIFLLGSRPGEGDMPGVAQFAAARMKKKHPGLLIAGTHHGYFTPEEEEGVIEKINDSHADFLCVAMGAPRQELFIMRNRGRLKCKVAIGVGGSLDVWAGNVKRAPEFWQRSGLEWLYRFIKEPSRYKRMGALPVFMIRTLMDSRKTRKRDTN
ncbi:MAG: WecB/TagA/CpsF family glycosyltransferase [Anaerovoracaceae bacterium]|jgi:N-acetylglucosaminyldiphosphoundecaprenol N-acetyl-beta-D-mannosaminyltransferase